MSPRPVLAALLLAALAAAATPPATPEPPGPAPTHANVAYGTHERQQFDLWLAPSPRQTPLVLHLHGGGWVRGDKGKVAGLARYLAAGISVASANYRFTTQAMRAGVEPPVAWPLADAARVLQVLRHRAAEWNLDPRRIAATGGSAGACSSLYLALGDDLAEPASPDPVARQSTRLWCVAVSGAQTTLDPAEMQAWTPNSVYGGHAFGFMSNPDDLATRDRSFPAFLAARERILPWIQRYSPFAHAGAGDPPTYLLYPAPPALGQPQKDPTHTANFGAKLQERLLAAGVPCELVYPGAPGVTHPSIEDFLVARLTAVN
ncbi:MAG: alpha/beta hydrolase [Verrucomicrobia bacterium]|nr:alpha/beta hydrolase [Verrucomicrobiota bacterium]